MPQITLKLPGGLSPMAVAVIAEDLEARYDCEAFDHPRMEDIETVVALDAVLVLAQRGMGTVSSALHPEGEQAIGAVTALRNRIRENLR